MKTRSKNAVSASVNPATLDVYLCQVLMFGEMTIFTMKSRSRTAFAFVHDLNV